MQIRTKLNESGYHPIRENVVQKVFETTDAREDEEELEQQTTTLNVAREFSMYIQVSSYPSSRDLHKMHFKWSLCSIDKLKSNCSFLIKYLLANSLLLSCQRRIQFILSKCYDHESHQIDSQTGTLLYGVEELAVEQNNNHQRMEQSHKSLTIDKSFILLLLLHSTTTITTTHQSTTSTMMTTTTDTNFYIKLYKILLNLFYVNFNNKTNCHHVCRWWYPHHQYQQQRQQSCLNIYSYCGDLSTKTKTRNLIFLINEMNGIENHHQNHHHRCSLHVKLRTLNLLCGILLIQRHVMFSNSSGSSVDRNKNKNNKNNKVFSDNQNVKQCIQLQLLAHNQIISYVKATWHHHHHHQHHHEMKIQLSDDKSCHEIENGMSTLATTSNHKLKPSAANDNDTSCHHDENEKFSNCYQQFHRAFRSNDSVKSHLNAILFLIILCIPLLTAASTVHNLKYSTNVVKTKYGPLRGIILRSTPTVEGYFGVPYGECLFP